MDNQDTTPPLTQQERQVIAKIRQAQKQSNNRPFVLVVSYPGGKAPIKFFRAEPSGRIDTS